MVGTGDCFKDKLEDPAHKIFFTQPLHGPLEKREEKPRSGTGDFK